MRKKELVALEIATEALMNIRNHINDIRYIYRPEVEKLAHNALVKIQEIMEKK